MKKLAMFLILLGFCNTAFSAGSIYWLRGTDLNVNFMGGNEFFMVGSPPGSLSNETILPKDLSGEPSVIGTWYTTAFPSEFSAGGTALFWATSISGSEDSMYRVVLYEYDSAHGALYEIAHGAWLKPRGMQGETSFGIAQPYKVKAGNRLAAAIEAYAESGSGNIEIIVDKPSPFTTLDWNASSGQKYSAFGASAAAALYLDICSASSVLCSSGQQCYDGNFFTNDVCTNPGTCSSYCVNSRCNPGCTTHSQCDDSDLGTDDLCKGIGTCNAYCSNTKCNAECNSDNECSSLFSAGSQCVLAGTCGSFCAPACVGDSCASGINVCGNGICESGEDCSKDCGAISLEIISPEDGPFAKGEQINVAVKPKGIPPFGVSPEISMAGALGSAQLFDDGLHSDGVAGDGIYGGTLTVPGSAVKGYNKETFVIKAGTASAEVANYFAVNPLLTTDLNVHPSSVVVGQPLIIEGIVARNKTVFNGDVIIKAESETGTVFSTTIETNDAGYFYFSYVPNAIDAGSVWRISVSATDAYGNLGSAGSVSYISSDENGGLLEFTLLNGFNETVHGLQKEVVSVEVKDGTGKPFSGAIVQLSFRSGEVFRLDETGNGVYGGEIIVPDSAPQGKAELLITARKIEDGYVVSGFRAFGIEIKSTDIKIETNGLLEKYGASDSMEFSINADYLEGTPADAARAEVLVDGRNAAVRTISPGRFSASYPLEGEEGEKTVSITVFDDSGRTATLQKKIDVKASQGNIASDVGLILIAVVVLLTAAGAFVLLRRNAAPSRNALNVREKELLANISELQDRYFKKGMMDRKKYYELMLKYESELKTIREELSGK